MSQVWDNEEVELLEVLRPKCTLREVQSILEKLGYSRSLKAISKKARQFNLTFQGIGMPDLKRLSHTAMTTIHEMIDGRGLEKNCLTNSVPVYPHPEGHYVKGVSTLINSDGNTVMQWYKTSKENESKEIVLRKLLREIPELVDVKPGSVLLPSRDLKNNVLSVYPLGDPHIGMLAWGEETGEDFDHKIATQRLVAAMEYLVDQSEPTSRALIVNLGDFFHIDNNTNLTPRGKNTLDADTRWAKILRVGLAAKIQLIELALRRHEKVDVIVEIGNHDDHTAIFLSIALDAYYRNEPRVTIDLSPAKCHYFRFHQNLIGVTHGDTLKPKDLESIMSCDKPQDWGECTNRYWYIGHIHHSSKHEFRGCSVESFRTLAPKDAWHARQGYRSRCDMTKIILDKDYGEVFRATVDSKFLKALK